MQAFLNDSAAPLWKDVEKSCVSDCILQCVLSTNLTLQHRLLRKLIPFRFLKMGIQAAKTLIPYNAEENKFLWLNKNVKYKRNPLIIKKSKKKSNLHYTRRITPKRVTSCGAHLRGLAPGRHSSEETSQRWRVVGDTVPI